MPDVKHFDPDTAVGTVVELLWQRGWPNTGIADVLTATGLSRSSLYATFGGKNDLFVAAVRRYLADYVDPMFDELASGNGGLADLAAFFDRLISARCTGRRARWGCLATNLHSTTDATSNEVASILAEHQQRLRDALTAALTTARDLGQLRDDLPIADVAEHLALLAQGINVRSRAGADPRALRRAVETALTAIRAPSADVDNRSHYGKDQ